MSTRFHWLIFLIVAGYLPAAPAAGDRAVLGTAIAPTYLRGNPRDPATITRMRLSTGELYAPQRVSFALRMRNFAELQARIERGEILSLEEMDARYFPTPGAWDEVARWTRSQGFQVEPADRSRLTVTSTSSVAHVQTVLQMQFARVRGTDAREHTSAITAPSIPAHLRDRIVTILHLQPHLQPVPAQIRDLRQLDSGYILPQTFAQLYNATSAGIDGRGQTIAVMGANRVDPFDLATFWQTSGLPTTIAQFTQVDLSTNPMPGDSSRASEETMDVEWASAMAPGANIVLLTSVSIDLVSAWIISQRSAGRVINQLTSSYTLPEATYPQTASREANNQYYASLAAIGVSVFVASGDDGSTQLIVGTLQPNRGYHPAGTASPAYPASSPFVTGVGGTTVAFQFTPGGAALPVREGAWSLPNIAPPSLVGSRASGGGTSLYFARPSWQSGPGLPAGTTRCVPDVAALASCTHSPYMQFLGRRFTANGTSVAAPIWAGLCALINQARADRGMAPVGLLGPKIYPLNGTAAFNQMTTGSQSGGDGFSTTATNGAYAVGPNYNLVAGLGSPNIGLLIAALTVPEPAPPTPEPPPPAQPPPPTTPPPAPPAPSPSAGSGGGGGGAPSGWFYAAIGLLLLARRLRPTGT